MENVERITEMYEYLVIDTDGEETHVESKEKPTLGEMQETVKGYIEVVHCLHEGEERQMIINEEGKLINLDVNEKATRMFKDFLNSNPYFNGGQDYIVAKRMILKNFELD